MTDALIVFDDGNGREGHDILENGRLVQRYRQTRDQPDTGVMTRPARPSTPVGRAVASRSRERRAHRSTKATRAGPSSDDDPPGEPGPNDALTFAVALRSHLRALHAVLHSEFREVGGISPASHGLLDRELHGLRETVSTFIEAERVAEAVGIDG